MRESIFDFTMSLQDANYLFLIGESKYVLFILDYKLVSLTDRRDFSISSSLRERDDTGNVEYNNIIEYCDNDERCLKQTLYSGYFEYANIFGLYEESPSQTIVMKIISESIFADVLKIKGYEYYGFVSNKNRFIMRGMRTGFYFIAEYHDYHQVYFPKITESSQKLTVPVDIGPNMIIKPASFGFGNILGNNLFRDSQYRNIFPSAKVDGVRQYGEISISSRDHTFNISRIRILAAKSNLMEVVHRAVTITYKPSSAIFLSLDDYTSNFDIILNITIAKIDGIVSDTMNFKIRT